MEPAAPKKNQVLAEANQLVSNGLCQAAIDLLEEYLETDPHSSTILNLLGRAYIIDQQHLKAVDCLRRAKDAELKENTPSSNSVIYQPDIFDNDDMAYIDQQRDRNEDESYLFDDELEPAPTIEAQTEEKWKTDDTHRENPISRGTLTLVPTEQDDPHHEERQKQQQIDWLNEGDQEEIEEECPNFEETVFGKCITEELDQSELDDSDDLLIPTSLVSSEEELGEQSWDDLDIITELGEFSEGDQQQVNRVQDDGSISREKRAQQIAIEVLENFEWSHNHLLLLQNIFIENGWSAARVSIEREIQNGVLPGELALARKVRIYWSVHSKFWTTFHKVGRGHTYYRQADAAYRVMSWPEAITIIRCFPAQPDIEEVYALIYEAYEVWYSSRRLRTGFQAFFKFLKYRTGSMDRTLPGDCPFYFHTSIEADSDVESSLLNAISPVSHELQELGFHLNQWPRPAENIMKISTEWL